ncbi:glycoside hydrolase family 6 protein [Trebonia kvetii]|uniref:glycoside hydrolase family 6 protein n=1 Tax=Trebonia kvetii TaxID=2480626 RepID=UPI001651CBAF|nr:glycoside hydrolase family 6 protein [Trebonia kvetii]
MVLAALLAALGLAVASGAVAVPAVAATSSCAAAYSVPNDWGSGFTASLAVTNNGTAAITGWTVTYTYAGTQTLSSGWNGTWTQSGKTVTVTNASYNGALAAGASASAGANFNYTGTNAAPASVTCTPAGSVTPPPGSINATPASLNVTQGSTGTFTLALSSAPTANETVSIAASGNTGLTASPASLTFTPANFSAPQTVTVTANATGTGTTTFTATGSGYTAATITATEVPSSNGTPSLMVTPASQTITQGTTGTVGISLSSAPSSNVTVSVARTSGNTGLSVTAGSSLTFTPANFATAQSVTITADSAGSGAATFTVSASGLTSVTFAATEAAACTSNCTTHVADPYTGAKPYLNPDFVKEVQAQASADGNSAAEAAVGTYQTAIWLDQIAAINGGGTTGRTGLQQQLTNAAAQGTTAIPSLVEIVVYDLPGRDCAALASNGEIPATAAGLTEYESQYIDPIASILSQFASSPIRIVAIIEPDSLPNVVTNQSKSACATATPYYETGITYALNKLHAIPNVYNYLDIAHSAWLGWPSNMSGTPAVYNTVVKNTTAGYASIDGFISDTANYTPTQEPLLTNPTLSVGGQPVDSATFYQYNPTFDELTYDTQMYNTLVSAGFPSSKKFLIDTSRNGWGPTHPTTITAASDVNTYVTDNKIDKRPFRGDWCNQNNAGIGARPTDQPLGGSSPILAYVWTKPPGESDGDYPTSTHSHGDPHCDPSGTNTDGNGGTYSTGSIPGFDVPAGQWYAAEFQMLVKNAFPAL